VRGVPPGSTVILDGICPYNGPAILFEGPWDVGGALTLALRRPVTGDVVSPRMTMESRGLATSIYKEPSFYRYGPNLFVYDARRRLLTRLSDARSAVTYFSSRRPVSCPGYVARGAAV
jgi:hypothetical protein